MKKSSGNGLYNPETKEILLHNKNFKSPNALMYTAIHEFTHHVLTTEKGVKTAKCHSGAFWATFYDLVDSAIEKGIYRRERGEATKKLVEEAKAIQKEILNAQKRLGHILGMIYDTCYENGERYEDVIESDLQLTRGKAKDLRLMAVKDCCFSDEVAKAVASAKTVDSAMRAAESGKTVAQVKAAARQKPPEAESGLDAPQRLIREKERLERTIGQLQDRLVQVEETLRSIQGEG